MEGEPFECPMRPFGGADAFAWSPDSKSLVYVSRKLKGMEYVFSTDSNLFLYNLEDGSTRIPERDDLCVAHRMDTAEVCLFVDDGVDCACRHIDAEHR